MNAVDELLTLGHDIWLCRPSPGGGAPYWCRVEFHDGEGKRRIRGCVGDTWEEAAERALGEVREVVGDVT